MISVVVSGVADIEWSAWVPERRAGMSVDVTGCELECDFFDDIFKRVVGKVTYEKLFLMKHTSLEYFAFPELPIRNGMSIKLSARNQR